MIHTARNILSRALDYLHAAELYYLNHCVEIFMIFFLSESANHFFIIGYSEMFTLITSDSDVYEYFHDM